MPSTSSCTSTGTSSDEEWDGIRCPICMDHPHNAVRLNCSSINCKCFICNTSYRHSNCLDRFKRPPVQNNTNNNNNEENVIRLKCPLCRGDVTGWTVNEEARQYMDKKSRDCSRDRCEFHGNYEELRRHARRDHPLSRLTEVDPSRQRRWRQIERQHEMHDVVSAIRLEIPGAVVVGDYAVEADEIPLLDETTAGNTDGSPSLWTSLVLGPVMGSPIRSSLEESRESHVEPSTARSSRRRRRYPWGENLLGSQYDDGGDGVPESHDDGELYNDDATDDNTHMPRRRLDDDNSNSNYTRIGPLGDHDNSEDIHTRHGDVDHASADDADADYTYGDGDDDDDQDEDEDDDDGDSDGDDGSDTDTPRR